MSRLLWVISLTIGIMCFSAALYVEAQETCEHCAGRRAFSYDNSDGHYQAALASVPAEPIDDGTHKPVAIVDVVSDCPACCPCHHGGSFARSWHYRIKPWMQATHWGYPENFVAESLGASLYAHMNTQVGNGHAAQLILYRYDFQDPLGDSAAQLNEFGLRRLKKMRLLLERSSLPLRIERVPNSPELDNARRREVRRVLSNVLQLPIAAERIQLVDPVTGLAGDEALEIYRNLLDQTQSGGGATLGSGGSTGGSLAPGVSTGR